MTSPTVTYKEKPNNNNIPVFHRQVIKPNEVKNEEIQTIAQEALTEPIESNAPITNNVTTNTIEVQDKVQEAALDQLPEIPNKEAEKSSKNELSNLIGQLLVQFNSKLTNKEAKKSSKNELSNLIGQLLVQFNSKLTNEPKFADPNDHQTNYKALVNHYKPVLDVLDQTVTDQYLRKHGDWASLSIEKQIIEEQKLEFDMPVSHITTMAYVSNEAPDTMTNLLAESKKKYLKYTNKYIDFLARRLEIESKLWSITQTIYAKLRAFKCQDEILAKLGSLLELLKTSALNLKDIKISSIQFDCARTETCSLSKEIGGLAGDWRKSRLEFRKMSLEKNAAADIAIIKIHYETIKCIYMSFEARVVKLHEMMTAIKEKRKEEVDLQEPHAALTECNLVSNAVILHLTLEDYKQKLYLPFVTAHTKQKQELAQIEIEISDLMGNCARAYKEVQDINDLIKRDGYFVTETRRGISSTVAYITGGLAGIPHDPEVKYPFDMKIVKALEEKEQAADKT